jgi:hypothetical protein
MGSRGSQNPHWQRWIPKPIIVGQVIAGSTGAVKTSTFQVPFPDSRLRVKISLLFKRTPSGSTVGTSPTATLWLAECDIDDSGMQGDEVPLTNIEGTFLAPTAIPADAGLLGYSREFVSAADYIQGVLRMTGSGVTGYWVLQTRYQPQSVSFSAEEWGLITAHCNPSGNIVTVG